MKRRKVIQISAYSATALFAAPLSAVLVSGCKTDSTMEVDVNHDSSPMYFSQEQYAFVRSVANTLLPETDTVGAESVGVTPIMDGILSQVFTDDQKKEYAAKLSGFIESVRQDNNNQSYSNLEPADQIAYLTDKDAAWRGPEAGSIEGQVYQDLRARIISTYLATEEVGTQLLNYLPVPGEYQSCITLETVGGKSWTL